MRAMAEIGPTTRVRLSPFYQATVEEGVTAFAPYNRMLMPVSYGNPEGEYEKLMTGVTQWDVAVERQVEIRGRDAADLVQILSVRDLSRIDVGKGKYIPMCDHRGTLINDPVVLKHDDGHFWLSIGDNNILMWARAIAAERRMEVEICEPDVSPMALQGPKAEEVVAADFRRLGPGFEVFLVRPRRDRRDPAGDPAVGLFEAGRVRALSDGWRARC